MNNARSVGQFIWPGRYSEDKSFPIVSWRCFKTTILLLPLLSLNFAIQSFSSFIYLFSRGSFYKPTTANLSGKLSLCVFQIFTPSQSFLDVLRLRVPPFTTVTLERFFLVLTNASTGILLQRLGISRLWNVASFANSVVQDW